MRRYQYVQQNSSVYSWIEGFASLESLETLMTRSLIDISALDVQVQEQVAKHGSVKDFHVALWRQEPDETGCNWNAHIERIRGGSTSDLKWWKVVPEMRERFNLN